MLMFTETTAQTIESRVKDQKRPLTQDGLLAERGGGDEGQKRGTDSILVLFMAFFC